MRRSSFLSLSIALAGAAGCSATAVPRPSATGVPARSDDALAADRAELLRLHEQARVAHLSKRAGLLLSDHADSVFSVSRGTVCLGSRADIQARFQRYLDSATFQAWDDIAPPRIRISADGQMA